MEGLDLDFRYACLFNKSIYLFLLSSARTDLGQTGSGACASLTMWLSTAVPPHSSMLSTSCDPCFSPCVTPALRCARLLPTALGSWPSLEERVTDLSAQVKGQGCVLVVLVLPHQGNFFFFFFLLPSLQVSFIVSGQLMRREEPSRRIWCEVL